MSMNDTLANALSHILNCEGVGKNECTVRDASKVMKKVLEIMKAHGYIDKIEFIESPKGNTMIIGLKGTINNCGTIKPRFPVKVDDYDKFEKRYLPAKDFGIMIVSTTKGLMTKDEAVKQKLGGKLISYCY
ncbi:30S ribosomal protein S8 [Candidatus Woesearchaeota archaeon]|jgi:small subunit ribosomal protein S8|nr:30S ribosomal protein S8 [Candidatus Woesearchaeota archaeon]MBT4835213.1 30S ribosomal protein S8 [Candidatus Woesearchaeota archaeon]MBT6734912.1 30S ribosomal protein S8 [Candidatus Woesearchaeota archaeon]MBT7169573.1 30S ribosomal protein S8 [Candidatus Woesearchaeota archaeon]MBT7474531.1 30S ribosomal protein S8 [Candidatus Woesearchaeota archaeon]